MALSIWKLSTKISSNFLLSEEFKTKSLNFLHKDIIDIDFSSNNGHGEYDLTISFYFNSTTNDPKAQNVISSGQEILDVLLNFLSFITGSPPKIQKEVSLKHKFKNTKKYRILLLSDTYSINPPINIASIRKNTNTPYEKYVLNALHFARQSLNEKDIFNSLAQLLIGVELFSKKIEMSGCQIRKCEKCKFEKKLKPGLRLKFKKFLINSGYLNETEAETAWEVRNLLFHGNKIIKFKEQHDYITLKKKMYRALAKGIKDAIGLDIEIPDPVNPIAGKGILDVTYIEPN